MTTTFFINYPTLGIVCKNFPNSKLFSGSSQPQPRSALVLFTLTRSTKLSTKNWPNPVTTSRTWNHRTPTQMMDMRVDNRWDIWHCTFSDVVEMQTNSLHFLNWWIGGTIFALYSCWQPWFDLNVKQSYFSSQIRRHYYFRWYDWSDCCKVPNTAFIFSCKEIFLFFDWLRLIEAICIFKSDFSNWIHPFSNLFQCTMYHLQRRRFRIRPCPETQSSCTGSWARSPQRIGTQKRKWRHQVKAGSKGIKALNPYLTAFALIWPFVTRSEGLWLTIHVLKEEKKISKSYWVTGLAINEVILLEGGL